MVFFRVFKDVGAYCKRATMRVRTHARSEYDVEEAFAWPRRTEGNVNRNEFVVVVVVVVR